MQVGSSGARALFIWLLICATLARGLSSGHQRYHRVGTLCNHVTPPSNVFPRLRGLSSAVTRPSSIRRCTAPWHRRPPVAADDAAAAVARSAILKNTPAFLVRSCFPDRRTHPNLDLRCVCCFTRLCSYSWRIVPAHSAAQPPTPRKRPVRFGTRPPINRQRLARHRRTVGRAAVQRRRRAGKGRTSIAAPALAVPTSLRPRGARSSQRRAVRRHKRHRQVFNSVCARSAMQACHSAWRRRWAYRKAHPRAPSLRHAAVECQAFPCGCCALAPV